MYRCGQLRLSISRRGRDSSSGCENELSEIASRMPNVSIAADRASPVSKGACSKNVLRPTVCPAPALRKHLHMGPHLCCRDDRFRSRQFCIPSSTAPQSSFMGARLHPARPYDRSLARIPDFKAAVFGTYCREYSIAFDDARFRRWYALTQALAITALIALALGNLGLIVTIFW